MTKFETNLSVVIEELQSKDVEQDAKDVDLQNQINSEVTVRTNSDTKLQANIDAEVSDRTAADQSLQDQITKEVTARVDGDKLLQNSIDVEVAARTDSDKQLQVNIDVEADARKSVDQDLQEQVDALNIAGTVQYFARQTAPTGWLKADGSAVSRAQYDKLFAAVGTMFGAGNGSTTFNLPDLRGEFIRGFDDGRGVDSKRVLGSVQTDALKSHTHSYIYKLPEAPTNNDYGMAMGTPQVHRHVYNSETEPTGGIETRPRNVALLACIKY